MSEAIYQQVEDAIDRNLHLGGPRKRKGYGIYGIHFRYPVAINLGNIVMRDSDCGLAKPTFEIATDEWRARVQEFGLFKMVGRWRFVPADDPAANAIRFCETNPEAAGRELHRLRGDPAVTPKGGEDGSGPIAPAPCPKHHSGEVQAMTKPTRAERARHLCVRCGAEWLNLNHTRCEWCGANRGQHSIGYHSGYLVGAAAERERAARVAKAAAKLATAVDVHLGDTDLEPGVDPLQDALAEYHAAIRRGEGE